jgi:hypothetical protein
MPYHVLLSVVVLGALFSPAFACDSLNHDTDWFVPAESPKPARDEDNHARHT